MMWPQQRTVEAIAIAVIMALVEHAYIKGRVNNYWWGKAMAMLAAPIAIVIDNVDQRSKDYGDIKDKFRPGHADYTYMAKYAIRDYRGGGRTTRRDLFSVQLCRRTLSTRAHLQHDDD